MRADIGIAAFAGAAACAVSIIAAEAASAEVGILHDRRPATVGMKAKRAAFAQPAGDTSVGNAAVAVGSRRQIVVEGKKTTGPVGGDEQIAAGAVAASAAVAAFANRADPSICRKID